MKDENKTKEQLVNELAGLRQRITELEALETKRKQVQEELLKTRDYLNNLLQYASAPIISWDAEQRITIFNTAFERLTGYMAGEVMEKPLSMLFPEASQDESLTKIRQTLSGEYWESVEIPILRKGGEIRIALWNSANIYDKDGKTILATIAQGQDITQRKQAEARVEHLNLVLKAIRSVNQLIITEKGRDRLLKSACQILVKVREYKFAWIGLVEEGHKKVLPVAQAGFEEGYLDSVKITWDDAETGKGPTGTAIKTKQPSLLRNIPEDPRFEPWRAEALKRGYLSSVAVPLVHDGKVYGALCVYSNQRDGFDDEETGLLVEVSDDLAFALKAIDDKEKHKQTEEALELQKAHFRQLFDNSPEGIVLLDDANRVVDANEGFQRLFQYPIEEIKGRLINGIVVPGNLIEEASAISRDARSKKVGRRETVRKRKDGSLVDVSILAYPIQLASKSIGVYAIYSDITERKRAEEEIIKLSKFPSENPNPVLRVAKDGTILYANEASTPLLNKWGCQVGSFLPGYYHKFVLKALSSKASKNIEVECGKQILSLTFAPVISRDEVNLYGLDVTERRQAEERLRQSEENLRTYLESAPDGIYINDLKGTFLYGNKKSEALLGYKKEELIGKSFLKLKILPAKDLAKAGKLLALNAMGRPTGPDEFEMRRKDGSHVWVEINTTPIKQESTVVLGFARDVTQRKQAEEELEESEQRFRAIFDNATDGILLADTEAKKFYTGNKMICQMLGYSLEEIKNLGVMDIHPKEDLPYVIEQFEKQSREEFTLAKDIPVKRKDGSVFYVEINSSSLTLAGKTYLVGIFRDITERKKMEENLIVTDRLASIGELASGIAHELNNPLTGVIGLSDLLLQRDLPDDIREDLKVISSEAQRTAGIVRNLLTFARKHPPAKEPINVNSIIEKVLELRAYEQKVSNIQVNTRFAPDLPEVVADSFQLQQVFLNIIINAEYFMTEAHGRGILTITTERAGNIIRASLADDGPGIAKEKLGHIFDPFFTTKEVGKGTGLGLSICHGIITEHGGRIYAESELGKGATFVVELPISK